MENTFCSEGLIELLDDIIYASHSMEELAAYFRKGLKKIASELYLGKADLEFQAPASALSPEGIHENLLFYEAVDGFEDHPVLQEFQTGDSGFVKITLYPEKSHSWTERELKNVCFVAKLFYMAGGRTRLMGMARDAGMMDNLTGLLNSHGLAIHAKKLIEKENIGDYDCLFLNIKNVKYINRRFSSGAADEALASYSRKVFEFVRGKGILARLGGDNFVILVQRVYTKELLELLSAMKVTVTANGREIEVELGSRAGIYSMQAEDGLAEGMGNASTALVAAKNSRNKDYVWFEDEMLQREMHDKKILAIFGSAIQNEEFVVYYQPKVTLEDKTLCGCEALVRWKRKGEIVPPMDFIPILEREGNICLLDFYVFEHACKDIRRWLDQGILPVKVSVNFSKLHLYDEQFAETVLHLMEKYRIDSKYLEIELTETASYEDYEVLTRFTAGMKDRGIDISIDDFGTGYSSLNLLKSLDVDTIKLDKSFIDDIDLQRETDRIVIKNIVNMVNELHMKIIAEGVETDGQASFLESVHCSMAQGFLFDKPLPCEEFEERLKEHRNYN
ncbi:MAG: EAL domain-containing protein [Blautia sp.]|nr:EAL domain-containing protein [Blautia sp.]